LHSVLDAAPIVPPERDAAISEFADLSHESSPTRPTLQIRHFSVRGPIFGTPQGLESPVARADRCFK
jgi:hypothetical protein